MHVRSDSYEKGSTVLAWWWRRFLESLKSRPRRWPVFAANGSLVVRFYIRAIRRSPVAAETGAIVRHNLGTPIAGRRLLRRSAQVYQVFVLREHHHFIASHRSAAIHKSRCQSEFASWVSSVERRRLPLRPHPHHNHPSRPHPQPYQASPRTI